jgi:hypothetical protein
MKQTIRILAAASFIAGLSILLVGCGGEGDSTAGTPVPAAPERPVIEIALIGNQGTSEADLQSPVGKALAAAAGVAYESTGDGGRVLIEDGARDLLILDYRQNHEAVVERLQSGKPLAAVVGVISVSFGTWEENSTQLALAREAGAELAAILVDTRIVDDEELIELVAGPEVVDRVNGSGYSAAGLPILRVDMDRAAENEAAAMGVIGELLRALRQV